MVDQFAPRQSPVRQHQEKGAANAGRCAPTDVVQLRWNSSPVSVWTAEGVELTAHIIFWGDSGGG